MRIAAAVALFPLVLAAAQPIVVDFESSIPILPDDKANRLEKWEDKGVSFTLARQPKTTKAKGLLMFYPHLSTGHKGIVCAMATEPIPVRATFPKPVTSVTLIMWGSTVTPALVEAFDAEGKVVDRARLDSVPGRKAPGDPVPTFTMSVSGNRIAYVEFSGPREGEFLVADEVRFTPAEESGPQ